MPVAHIVKPFPEQTLYFSALGKAIWQASHPAAAVRRTRSSRPFDPNSITLKTREELTPGLETVRTRLGMALQVIDYCTGKDEGLT